MKPGITIVEFTKPAKEYEEEMDAAFTEEAPRGKFGKSILNELVTAYRDVQRIMGFEGEDLYPMFESDQTEFPPEFVRGLAMLAKAAEDFGQPGMVDLSGIRDNSGVATLAAKVRALADDPEFEKFLKSEGEDDTMDLDEGMDEESEMDAMFSQRA